MAVLNREDFTRRVKEYFGDTPDDNQLSFMEDVMDTYTDSVGRSSDTEIVEAEWKDKYDQLDRDWRKRYTDRFYSGREADPESNNPGNNSSPEDTDNTAEVSEETYLFEDLFEKKEN